MSKTSTNPSSTIETDRDDSPPSAGRQGRRPKAGGARDPRQAGAPIKAPRAAPYPVGTATVPEVAAADRPSAPDGLGAIERMSAGGAGFNGGDLELPAPSERAVLSPQMKSAFARFRQSQLAQNSSRTALAMSKFMRIRLPYPRQIEAMAEIEELRLLGLEMRGEQQLALNIFERSGTGKSTIATQTKLMLEAEAPEGVKPVLHARLGTSGTARDLYVALMSELGDGFATSGTEHTLRRRAMYGMEKAGVQLVILDETQHSGNKSGFSKEVSAELKIMLDTGRVPFVLLGTEEAVPLIAADRELSGRMFSPCRLAPLDMSDGDDFELWQGFVSGLDARMVEDGIVGAAAGLAEESVALAFGEVCDGVIGQFMRVMLMALRNTIRDRREVVTIEDIAIAVDEWSIELRFAGANPFWKL